MWPPPAGEQELRVATGDGQGDLSEGVPEGISGASGLADARRLPQRAGNGRGIWHCRGLGAALGAAGGPRRGPPQGRADDCGAEGAGRPVPLASRQCELEALPVGGRNRRDGRDSWGTALFFTRPDTRTRAGEKPGQPRISGCRPPKHRGSENSVVHPRILPGLATGRTVDIW